MFGQVSRQTVRSFHTHKHANINIYKLRTHRCSTNFPARFSQSGQISCRVLLEGRLPIHTYKHIHMHKYAHCTDVRPIFPPDFPNQVQSLVGCCWKGDSKIRPFIGYVKDEVSLCVYVCLCICMMNKRWLCERGSKCMHVCVCVCMYASVYCV